jgi:acyl carrier protein
MNTKEQFVVDTITEILKSKGADTSKLEFNREAHLRDTLGLSSFNLAELTVKIENEFDVDIFEKGLIFTLGEVFDQVNK